jgi:hypothetical protein
MVVPYLGKAIVNTTVWRPSLRSHEDYETNQSLQQTYSIASGYVSSLVPGFFPMEFI